MSDVNVYDVGDLVEMTGMFTDLSGSPVSPATVVCTVRRPDGTEATPGATSTGTGIFTAEILVTQSGRWWYAFDGGPDATASKERFFFVRPQQVPRSIPVG